VIQDSVELSAANKPNAIKSRLQFDMVTETEVIFDLIGGLFCSEKLEVGSWSFAQKVQGLVYTTDLYLGLATRAHLRHFHTYCTISKPFKALSF
jgi:hypothetical protein